MEDIHIKILQLRADNLKKWRKLQDEFAVDGDLVKYRKALYAFRMHSATMFSSLVSVNATQ